MKKRSIFLSALLLLAMTGCGTDAPVQPAAEQQIATETAAQTDAETEAQTTEAQTGTSAADTETQNTAKTAAPETAKTTAAAAPEETAAPETKSDEPEIEQQEIAGREYDDAFGAAQTAFSLNLTQNVFAKSPAGKNVLVSPYSVMQAIALTANGADGETLAQMEQTLGGLPIADLSEYLCGQRNALPDTEDAFCKVANSVWFRNNHDDFKISQPYLQKASNYFDAAAKSEPFDGGTVQKVNNWCSQHTDGMIPKIIDSFRPDDMMCIINAVCFEAKWASVYEKEPTDKTFTAWDGTEQNAKMMYSIESNYLKDENASGFIKYYRGGKYAFAALLPKEGMTPEKYLASLSADDLRAILNQENDTKVRAGLPQFSYDYGTDLTGTLSDMGMPLACSYAADFSLMTETKPQNPLYIGEVLHKTHIDVDTEGTKAAAVTAVKVRFTTSVLKPEEYKSVILDRPFVYMLVETEHMTPIFIGTLNQIPD